MERVVPLLKAIVGKLCYRVFSSDYNFCKITFTDLASKIQHIYCSKLALDLKNDNDVTICWHDVIFKDFWYYFMSLVKFSYWSKFHVNNVIGTGVMIIFFYKGLTRNPKVGDSPFWVLPNIWRLGQECC